MFVCFPCDSGVTCLGHTHVNTILMYCSSLPVRSQVIILVLLVCIDWPVISTFSCPGIVTIISQWNSHHLIHNITERMKNMLSIFECRESSHSITPSTQVYSAAKAYQNSQLVSISHMTQNSQVLLALN